MIQSSSSLEKCPKTRSELGLFLTRRIPIQFRYEVNSDSDTITSNDALTHTPVPHRHVRQPLRHLLHLHRPQPASSHLHSRISSVDAPRTDRSNPPYSRLVGVGLRLVHPSKTTGRNCKCRLRIHRHCLLLRHRLRLLRIH